MGGETRCRHVLLGLARVAASRLGSSRAGGEVGGATAEPASAEGLGQEIAMGAASRDPDLRPGDEKPGRGSQLCSRCPPPRAPEGQSSLGGEPDRGLPEPPSRPGRTETPGSRTKQQRWPQELSSRSLPIPPSLRADAGIARPGEWLSR